MVRKEMPHAEPNKSVYARHMRDKIEAVLGGGQSRQVRTSRSSI
jgi:hypothetical protein